MNNQKENENMWNGADVISSYSRAQAIEDGFLVDISEMAREAGFKFPVAVTTGVWAVLNPPKELESEWQDVKGRAWDMLTILRYSIKGSSGGDEVHFAPLFTRAPSQSATPVKMYAKCGPGDNHEPVITVALEGED